ncbi:MAG: serine hydrolase domain-containing protein [Pseudomonadota bacterium]
MTSAEVRRRLEAKLPCWLAAHRVPGAALALVRRGQVDWVAGFGTARVEDGRPVEAGTVFQAASLGKTLVAWAIMRLAEMGAIGLDEPVETRLKRWRLPPSPFDHRAVTVRRILSHTAGLSLPDVPGSLPDQPLPSLEASLSGASEGAGEVRVIAPPGSRFSYSGGGYTLLHLLIEEACGEDFASHMHAHVLAQLGMQESAFEWAPELEPATAHAYAADGTRLPNFRFRAAAAAGLYATAGDLARFLAAFAVGPAGEPAGRHIVSAEGLATLTTPAATTGRVDGLWSEYGLGCEIESLPGGVRLVGHHGMNRGWRALMAAWPQAQAGLVVLTNSDRGMDVCEGALELWLADVRAGLTSLGEKGGERRIDSH